MVNGLRWRRLQWPVCHKALGQDESGAAAAATALTTTSLLPPPAAAEAAIDKPFVCYKRSSTGLTHGAKSGHCTQEVLMGER